MLCPVSVLPLFMLMSAVAVTAAAAASQSHPAPEHESSAFVHLFEWSWADVAKECEEWLGPKGFTAVQISPPNDHIQGPEWWTRYQPVTYKLVSRSGDKKAFTNMVQRCNKVGVGIYADAVINHIAYGSGISIAGSRYEHRTSPIYDKTDTHLLSEDGLHHLNKSSTQHSNCKVTDYTDKWIVQYCDLEGLPDLCTACENVQLQVAGYIKQMSDIGIAGFRVDAAKHQDAGELGQLLARVPQHLYRFQEVINSDGEAVKPEEYFENGQVTEFDYSRRLRSYFQDGGPLKDLNSFGEQMGLMPSNSAVVFLDNHDTQRGESSHFTYKNGKHYELANIFMLAHPYGYPKVMSSYHFSDTNQGPPSTSVHSNAGVHCSGQPTFDVSIQHNSSKPWVCEHRWPSIANMVAWRKSAGTHHVTEFQALGDDTIAFCRGAGACVALNNQKHASWNGWLKVSMPAGRYCDVIQSDDARRCPALDVTHEGWAHVSLPPLTAVALHVAKKSDATEGEASSNSDAMQGQIIFM